MKSGNEWREVLRGKPGPYLYLVGADGTVYDSYSGARAPNVTVEDEGPLRVSLAVKGLHASPSGVGLCPYTVRIHAYAGRSELRLFHTFVFDQNPDKLEFSEVGMNFPLDLGSAPRASFGGQGKTHSAERWSRAQILQSSDLAYEVAVDGKALARGEKSGGWASLSGPRASAFVALRDFWQQYPKGYEVTTNGSRAGDRPFAPTGFKVQFWPASSKQKLVYSTPWKERALYFNGYYGDPSATADSRDEATVKRLLEMYPNKPLNLKSFGPDSVEDLLWIKSMVDKYPYASAYSRAMGDVGISHANQQRPSVMGLMHYHSGHQWSGGYSPSHTLNTSFFLHYYLTGDRRMREIGREVADGAVRNQEKAGIISNRTRRLNREFTSPILCLMEAYVDSWDATYGDLARRSLKWFLLTQEKPGLFPESVFTRGPLGDEAVVEPVPYPVALSAMSYPTFYEALRHFDEPLLRKTVLAMADFVIDTGELGDHRAMFCSLAYEMTGDPIYAAYCKNHLEQYKASARATLEYKNIAFFSAIRNGEIPVLMGTVARAMKQDPAGLNAAEQRLKERLGKLPRTLPKPGVVPPERSLGVLRGYTN